MAEYFSTLSRLPWKDPVSKKLNFDEWKSNIFWKLVDLFIHWKINHFWNKKVLFRGIGIKYFVDEFAWRSSIFFPCQCERWFLLKNNYELSRIPAQLVTHPVVRYHHQCIWSTHKWVFHLSSHNIRCHSSRKFYHFWINFENIIPGHCRKWYRVLWRLYSGSVCPF